jgi:hypothetical protein
MFALYRHVKRKRAQKTATPALSEPAINKTTDQAEAGLQDPQITTSAPPRRTPLSWKIKLAVSLALPVYLETLDYTGTPFFTDSGAVEIYSLISVVATAQTRIAVRVPFP